MSDIGKRSAVYESGGTFGRLHQIRMDGAFQQYRDSSRHSEIFHRKGLVIICKTKQNIFNATAQVFHIFGKAENGHNFRSRSNIEARLLRDTVRLGSESDYDAA